jgi:predicted DNA-binding transcriptional regulator AlpA
VAPMSGMGRATLYRYLKADYQHDHTVDDQ